jgi:hypothetical protein
MLSTFGAATKTSEVRKLNKAFRVAGIHSRGWFASAAAACFRRMIMKETAVRMVFHFP